MVGRLSPGVLLPFNTTAKGWKGLPALERPAAWASVSPTFPRCTLHHICSSVSMEVIHNAGLVTVFPLFILSPITLVSKFYLDSSAEGSAEDKRWENVLNSVVLEWSAVVLPRRDIGNV